MSGVLPKGKGGRFQFPLVTLPLRVDTEPEIHVRSWGTAEVTRPTASTASVANDPKATLALGRQ
jgi:hypothetical protein